MKNILNILLNKYINNKNIFSKKSASFVKTDAAGLNLWFIKLRWIASVVSLILVIISVWYLEYLEKESFVPLLWLVSILFFSNIFYLYLLKRKLWQNNLTQIQIFFDLIILTLMLHFSGGIENPLIFLYIFHIILSGILLEKKDCYKFVVISILLFLFLALCELYEFIPHYTFEIFPHEDDLKHQLHAAHYKPFVFSLIFLQITLLTLTAYFITNIMQRLRIEEQIAFSERLKLKSVLEVTDTGLVIFNNKLEPIWFNEPIEKILLTNISKNPDFNYKLRSWISEHKKLLNSTLEDSKVRFFEKETVDSSGHQQFFLVTLANIVNAENNEKQVVELIQNITEKKTMEMELIQSSKMATLGTIAAGIAHEVGNPLSSISTRLELLKSNDDVDFKNKSLIILKNEISRIEKIVRGSKENWKYCNINELIVESIEILKYHKEAKNLNINLDLEKDLPGTVAVQDQLQQVFLNFGLNAAESMSGLPEATLTVKSYSQPGKICIEFIDKGIGIKQENIEKIFNPFWTSKQNGLGLGMFIVSQIIQAHGGSIITESRVNQGTKFIIKIPRRLKKE